MEALGTPLGGRGLASGNLQVEGGGLARRNLQVERAWPAAIYKSGSLAAIYKLGLGGGPPAEIKGVSAPRHGRRSPTGIYRGQPFAASGNLPSGAGWGAPQRHSFGRGGLAAADGHLPGGPTTVRQEGFPGPRPRQSIRYGWVWADCIT